jgi:transketolase
MPADVTQHAIDTIRTLAIDAVEKANSGHPGMPMGCAPMGYLLFAELMKHDPGDPTWADRDRFVLSAGHGSMLLYAALHLTGYERPTMEDIKGFRQLHAPTAGHPENFLLPAVETTTGPLGQGFANGVGMALAAERLAAEFNRPGHEIVDHDVYAIVSDGDLMEGVAAEAASLAGHLKLGRLIYLYDDNGITIDGETDLAFSEDVLGRFDAYGWHTQRVSDGTDLEALRAAIKSAKSDERPSLIAVRTVIGHGAPNKGGTSASHGAALGAEEVEATKKALDWPHHHPFTVPDDVREHMDRREDGGRAHREWDERFAAYRAEHPELAAEFERRVIRGQLPEDWADALPTLLNDDATRKHSGAVINAIADAVPELLGGSADLAGSNNTDVKGGGDFGADDRLGRNLRFGVREHAMAAIANGMSLHGGIIPYAATFLIFTDYARPAIRLSALMDQKVVWVMTHDSIGLGEDGPTHQPIEHLASLRAIPNLTVLRPADGQETVAAWKVALESDGPSLLALTRQGLPHLGPRPEDGVERGAYVLRELHDGEPELALLATGSEVHLALQAAETLADEGVSVRVVSMPSWERFAAQDRAYRDQVLPPGVRARVAVEAAVSQGWERWVGEDGEIIAMDRFGASAPAGKLFETFGFTADRIVEVAREVLDRTR